MRTNRPYVQIDPDVLERVRQIDLLSYLREFEPSNLVKVKGTSNVYCTAEHDSLKISNGKWYWWSRGFGGYSALDYLIKVKIPIALTTFLSANPQIKTIVLHLDNDKVGRLCTATLKELLQKD